MDPYTPPPPIGRVAAPMEEGLLDDPTFAGWAADGTLSTALYFRRYVDRWPDRAAAVLRTIADAPEGGVLFHCQRGRDRTGLVSILLLSLVGVPAELIVEDHLRTDARLVATGVAMGHVGLDGEPEVYAAAGTTAEATLFDLLSDLDVATLLRTAGWTTAHVDDLRARLLE